MITTVETFKNPRHDTGLMLKTIRLLKRLERYPIFDIEIFASITKKTHVYAKLALHRLERHGLVYRLERNKYTLHKNPLLIASHLTWPSYISFWSALRWHNLTEQLPQDIWVVTPRKRKKAQLVFNSTKINFVKINKRYFFGFSKAKYQGFEIWIAEPEKAIIDSLLFRKVSVGEIKEIIKLRRRSLSTRKMLRYANETSNKNLLQKIKGMV